MDEISRTDVVGQLRALGVVPGDVLQVHTAFSKVTPVEGGPVGLVEALREALGADGTLVMPSMSDDDDHVFDPRSTPCRGMGIVAETFRQMPGVLRSDSPHAFAAIGPAAGRILAPHPCDVPHGLDSPVGRVHEMDGSVLLLGVNHSENTTVHLAENLAGVRYGLAKHLTIDREGVPARVEYREVDHCCARFDLVDAWLDDAELQRHGTVGHATARLARARDVVRVVTARLAEDELVFLHPFGVDEECDEARPSLS